MGTSGEHAETSGQGCEEDPGAPAPRADAEDSEEDQRQECRDGHRVRPDRALDHSCREHPGDAAEQGGGEVAPEVPEKEEGGESG